jgi:CRISPR/Cas system type I-B associated protein Csh2 (Cas7 group RAMP superfamily)
LYALFVSGQKLVEGTLKDMNQRFVQEIGVHSASVEVREQTEDGWIKIRSRMRHQ